MRAALTGTAKYERTKASFCDLETLLIISRLTLNHSRLNNKSYGH